MLAGALQARPRRPLLLVPDMAERYIADAARRGRSSAPLKVVCACGNGTAGAFAPQALRRMGCEVIEMDCELDYTFPNYNPNPEDIGMLHAMGEAVREHGADLAWASTATATAAGWSTTRARRSSPTRSA